MIFNGEEVVRGSASSSSSYEKYKTIINRESLEVSVVSLKAVQNISGNSLSLDVNIENLSETDITNAVLMAVTYEDLGTEKQHYVVRKIMPSDVITISYRQSKTFNLTADYTYSPTRLKAVVFLQLTSGPILQSTLAAAQ